MKVFKNFIANKTPNEFAAKWSLNADIPLFRLCINLV